jgi:hypothetical protein
MKRLYFLCLLISAASFSACDKEDIAQVGSACIKKKITSFSNATHVCTKADNPTGANVKEYYFQDKLVYVFDEGSCISDGISDVYDAECNFLGQLGGLAGFNNINGQSFSSAEFRRTLWEY